MTLLAKQAVLAIYPDAGEDCLLRNIWKTSKIQGRDDFLGSSWADAASRLPQSAAPPGPPSVEEGQ